MPVPILNPDSGLYAYYAQQILSGVSYPVTQPDLLPAFLFASLSQLFSVHLDWIIFLAPVFVSSLIVIPIILIGRTIQQTKLGFFAALFVAIDFNFYGRSGLGYYDTDILNLFFPLLIIYFMMQFAIKKRLHYALMASFSLWLFGLWYHSAAPINFSLLINFLFLTLMLHRKNALHYQAFFLLVIAILPLDKHWLPIIAITFYFLFKTLNDRYKQEGKYYFLLVVSVMVIALLSFDFSRYYKRGFAYFNAPTMKTIKTGTGEYYYYNQMKTVGEAQGRNILKPDGTYSQQTTVGILATVGYLLMLIVYPSLLYTLPLMFLGYASYYIGNRFLMYASPEFALGLVFLIFILFENWNRFSTEQLPFRRLRVYMLLIFLLFALEYVLTFNKNRGFILNFDNTDVKGLRELSTQLTPKDTIITWWDFGWPIWYYAGTSNTMTDNGLHGGIDSYAVSKIYLSSSPSFVRNASCFFSEKMKEAHQNRSPYFLGHIAKTQDLDQLFTSLSDPEKQFECPEGDVYIFMHGLIVSLLEYIYYTSGFDLRTAKAFGKKALLYDQFTSNFDINGTYSKGIRYDFNNTAGTIKLGDNDVPVHNIAISSEHIMSASRNYDNNTTLNLVVANQSYAFYLDDFFFNSFYVQAYFFDNYDRNRFEKVIDAPHMKVFKIKKTASQ